MGKQEEQLIVSLHCSTEHIVNMYRLIKAPPPNLEATSVIQYARLIQNLLLQFFSFIPKLCVPMSLFKRLERESINNSQMYDQCMKQQAKILDEMRFLSLKLKQSEEREKKLKESIAVMLKNNVYYKKKAQSLKKSGEQSIKNILEIASSKVEQDRRSLPRLDKKQKLSLLWLMGPTGQNQKLVNHLINKV